MKLSKPLALIAIPAAAALSLVAIPAANADTSAPASIHLGTNAAAHCYTPQTETGTVAVYAYNDSGFTLDSVRVHSSLGADQVFTKIGQGKAAYATYKLPVGHVAAGTATVTAYAYNGGHPVYKSVTVNYGAVDCIKPPSGTASIKDGKRFHDTFVVASYTNTSIRPVKVKLNTPFGPSAQYVVKPGHTKHLRVYNAWGQDLPAGTAYLNTYYNVEGQGYFTGYNLPYAAVNAFKHPRCTK